MHTAFWRSVLNGRTLTERDRQIIKQTMDESLGRSLRFQRETWASVKLSASARKFTLSPGYLSAKQEAIRPPSNPNIPYDRRLMEASAANGDKVIEAAASGSPMNVRGQSVYITTELADRILSGLDGSLVRMERLANPIWDDAPPRKEHKYPELRIALLTDTPFNKSESSHSISGLTLKLVQLMRNISDDKIVGLGISQLPLATQASDTLVISAAQKTLESIGLKSSNPPSVSSFRGNMAAVFTASGLASGATMASSVRAVFRTDTKQIIVFMSLTTDIPTAIALREALEADVQLTN